MSIAVNYPADEPLTSFIGRDGEQVALLELLDREDVRLVTVIGPGGIGKTRLALKVSLTAAGISGYRRWVVQLESVQDPALVSLAVARALGVQEQQDLDLAIAAFLGSQPSLIVIDNFEQVAEAAPFLSGLLRQSDLLKLLVTSRSPLRISGEHIFETPPMTLPQPQRRMDGDVLETSEAMRLFMARALAVNPHVPVSAASFPAIAGICERLDGLPLAIELAAARASVLTPQAMLARLDTSLHLLTQGARDQPERLQSLRGAIAWSYDLLLSQDQAIFRRLSTFSQSFSYEAVEQIVEAQTLPGLNVLDAMANLVDSSLVRLIAAGDNEIRYRMFETIREFDRELMVDAGEFEAMRRAHAIYFAELVREAVMQLHNVANDVLLDHLDHDLGNFREALTTLTVMEEWDRLLQMSGDIAWFLYYRGQVIEGQRWTETALQHAHHVEQSGSHAWALIGSGLMTQVIGDAAGAEQRFAKAASIADQVGEESYRFVATSLRAGALVTLGHIDEAASLFETNLDRTRHVPHQAWLAHAKFQLGIIAFSTGRLDDARALFAESIELCDQSGSYMDATDALQYLSLVQIVQHQFDSAGKTIADLLDRLERRKSESDLAIGIAVVAMYVARLADPDSALRLFAAASQLRLQTGLPFPEPAFTLFISEQSKAESKLPAEEVEAQRQSGRSMTAPETLAAARASLTRSIGRVPVGAASSSGKLKFSLTDREIDVLRLIADGLTNEQIAGALFISSGTVRTHVANIFGKLHARTRTEAARIALRDDLI